MTTRISHISHKPADLALTALALVFVVAIALFGVAIYAGRNNDPYPPPPAGCHWEMTHSKGYYVAAVCP